MSKSIYDQHDAAFANVSAYVIMKGTDRVATIAFKFPRDDAGRLYVYVHWLGTEMVRGHANGYGYDKRTAACANAARKVENSNTPVVRRRKFFDALAKDGGSSWESALISAGFTVMRAV